MRIEGPMMILPSSGWCGSTGCRHRRLHWTMALEVQSENTSVRSIDQPQSDDPEDIEAWIQSKGDLTFALGGTLATGGTADSRDANEWLRQYRAQAALRREPVEPAGSVMTALSRPGDAQGELEPGNGQPPASLSA